MKKEMRMFAGIILHPVRVLQARIRRPYLQAKLMGDSRERTWHKNHERMHNMSVVTNTAYTSSPLYLNLYSGAVEW